MVGPQAGSAARGPALWATQVTPQNPGRPRRYGKRQPEGNNRTTVRSALLTVASFAERCLHDLTSSNMNGKCLVMGAFEGLREGLAQGVHGELPPGTPVLHARR